MAEEKIAPIRASQTIDKRHQGLTEDAGSPGDQAEATCSGQHRGSGEGVGSEGWDSDIEVLRSLLKKGDPLKRIVLVSDLFPSISADVLRVGLAQFGSVRRVLVRKDLLNPSATEVTWTGASALVEMSTAKEARAVVDECTRRLIICGAGPRPVRAVPATLAMLDEADWPEAHLYQLVRQTKLGEARAPLYLVEAGAPEPAGSDVTLATQDGDVPTTLQQRTDAVGLERWKEAKAMALGQDADLRMFEAKVSALQKEEHRRHQRTLDIQEWKFVQLERAAPNVSGKGRPLMRIR